MRTKIVAVALVLAISMAAAAETAKLKGGPSVRVGYDPAVWRSFAPQNGSEPGTLQGMTWELRGGGVQVSEPIREVYYCFPRFTRRYGSGTGFARWEQGAEA